MQHGDFTTDEPGDEAAIFSDQAQQQVNKRLTLNLLIQGAAMHTFLTGHHLVRDELESVRPGLTRLYDRFSVSAALNYFIGDIPLLYGLPVWFWNRIHRPQHPFHRHRLLAEHGRQLWRASKWYLIARGWKKWVIGVPLIHYVQLLYLFLRMMSAERDATVRLARIAESANAQIWGIDEDRLDGELTTAVAFGYLREPKTFVGQLTRRGAIGYGGVQRRQGRFTVVAKAWNWPLVLHELTKGTLELICLHGLNTLDDDMYEWVTEEADQLEYETWMLQSGAELWRRLLAALPEGQDLAETVMHLARLEPERLEALMMAVVQDAPAARILLAQLRRGTTE